MHIKSSFGACRRFIAKNLAIALLLAAGPAGLAQSLDPFNPSPNDEVDAIAIQTDGRILLGGWFTALGAQPCNFLGRVANDGSVDTNFNAGSDGPVYSIAVQDDGKIIVGGWFGFLNGDWRECIGRLNADGTLDTGFNPVADSTVYCIAQQADGKILIGGNFTTIGGKSHNRIARLNPDGSLDASFNPSASDTIYCLAVQPDGRIVVGGIFNSLNGLTRNAIGRLNADGSIDATFNPNASDAVYSLAIHQNGKLTIGGWFTKVGGLSRTNMARLNPDGTIDLAVQTSVNNFVRSTAMQANGKIILGGGFSAGGWPTTYYAIRLAQNGVQDSFSCFSTYGSIGAFSPVLTVGLQDDGAIMAGGCFTTPRPRAARWANNETATQSVIFDGSSILWLRGGSAVEVWRTTFEISTNGNDWISVGAGVRTNGGWKLTGLSAPSSASVRARGWVSGGGSSSWVIETLTGPPVIRVQPVSRTNNAGTTATFTVQASGLGPLGYQWFKGALPLADGGNVSGSTSAALSIGSLTALDAGSFLVVVTNAYGCVTSSIAALRVIDPIITGQPSSQTANMGQTVAFSVTAIGAFPLCYQWRQGGIPIDGAVASVLSLTNVQASAAGNYDVVVSNSYGSATSAVAALTVNLVVPDGFNPSPGYADQYSLGVAALALQADGKIMIGGSFQTIGQQTSPQYVARLTTDGIVDGNYAADGSVLALCVGPRDTWASGTFLSINGRPCGRIASLATSATIYPRGDSYSTAYAMAQQQDDYVVVAGSFSRINDSPSDNGYWAIRNLARIHALSPAWVDATFNPSIGDGILYSVAVQPNGKILFGGAFGSVGGWLRSNLSRVGADAVLDLDFAQAVSNTVYSVVVQPDGKILVGGAGFIMRLNEDGKRDTNFSATVNGDVYSMALQTDGRVLLGGSFSILDNQARGYIGRLNPDGTLDSSFYTGANGTVRGLALQDNGKVLVGGTFTTLGSLQRSCIGRLSNTDAATQSLSFNGTTVTWLRGGTSSEVWRTSFEASTNGTDWVDLGAAARIVGGWQLTPSSTLATNSQIRARGWTTGGQYNGSSWFVETVAAVNPQLAPQVRVPASGAWGTNGFTLAVSGLAGQVVVVEAATNLTPSSTSASVSPVGGLPVASASDIWTPTSTNTLGNGPLYFSDPSAFGLPWRFYRARLQ